MFPAPRPDSYNRSHYIDLIVNIEYMTKVMPADQQALLARHTGAKPVPGVAERACLQEGALIATALPDAFSERGFDQAPANRRRPVRRTEAFDACRQRGGAGGHAGKTAIT
jgi:hypothetical protein